MLRFGLVLSVNGDITNDFIRKTTVYLIKKYLKNMYLKAENDPNSPRPFNFRPILWRKGLKNVTNCPEMSEYCAFCCMKRIYYVWGLFFIASFSHGGGWREGGGV